MNDANYYKLDLVETTFNVGKFAVFYAAYRWQGYNFNDAWINDRYVDWCRTGQLPAHILSFCSAVLDGKAPFIYADNTASLLV